MPMFGGRKIVRALAGRRVTAAHLKPLVEAGDLQGAVIPGGDPLALEPTGPMTADLGIGRAIVQGAAPQGAYPVAVTEPEPLVFTDGDPSNPRTDLVVLRIYDAAHDDSGQVQAAVEVLPGTPVAAPEPPPCSITTAPA